MSLPIEDIFPDVQIHFQQYNRLVLQAPPGAGKSTWLPLQLLKSPWLGNKKILMLEPRRLAARNIAQFLASQLQQQVGDKVGFAYRGERKVSNRTKLEIVTEGVLTRRIQNDPELSDIGLIIFDEFHERNINADLGLALCCEIQQGLREDLRLLVMSATLEKSRLVDIFTDHQIRSEGRGYPIDIQYIPCNKDDINATLIDTVEQSLIAHAGNLLVFLPGVREIKRLTSSLESRLKGDVLIAPLYGQLEKSQQWQAINLPPQGKRKLVLATNVAETSLTIEGISVVIDSGLQRKTSFNIRSGVTQLNIARISKAAATQRAGRAGRLEAGYCYRLWSKEQQDRLVEHEPAEILCTDISNLMFEVTQWGSDLDSICLIDQPSRAQQQQATELLEKLGAITAGKLTAHGNRMANLGTSPRIANMLIYAQIWESELPAVTNLACYLAALLEESQFNHLDVAQQLLSMLPYNIEARAKQWATKLGIKLTRVSNEHLAGLLLAAAFPDRIAQRRGKSHRYLLANGYGCFLGGDNAFQNAELIVVIEVIDLQVGEGKIFSAAELELKLLERYLPHLITQQQQVVWNNTAGQMIARQREMLGKLVLSETVSPAKISEAQKTQAFIDEIRSQNLQLLPWNQASEQLLLRVNHLHQRMAENDFPLMDKVTLLQQLESWLAPYLIDVVRLADLQQLNLVDILLNKLSWQQQQQLSELAPTHYVSPTGTKHNIRYLADEQPILAIRLQELYGLTETPSICNGAVPLTLELLSPARRPIQVTTDLAGFWQGSYKEVQKEMKGRYPKHFWPDDPANSRPTNKVKSRM